MARPSGSYEPRRAANGVLHQIVLEHLETFRAEARRSDGDGLPAFVEREFREFLTCGVLANGFARFRCAGCGLDRFLPFSCKGRGLCPSCGGRRMTERAAHLVDDVFPDVAVRQWVLLTTPHRLRYRLAWDHALCRAVVAVYLRAVLGFLRRRAHVDGVVDGRGGAVAILQRFGAALNVNVHVHALVLDGVFAPDGAGGVRWHPLPGLCADDVAAVLARVERRLGRRLARRGLLDPDDVGDPPPESPVLAGIAAASVQGLVAIGPRAGGRLRRGGGQDDAGAIPLGRCHARWDGWDLHAGLVIPPGDRERLDRVCRYTLRPPVAEERVSLTTDGQVRLTLRRRWTDGTTGLLFDPVDFLARLAALTPRPRVNLILYHGLLAPRAAWRRLVVPSREPSAPCDAHAREAGDEPAQGEPPPRDDRYLWAALMQRSFGFDVLACPRCGGRLRLLALIEQSAVVRRILGHLGVSTALPVPLPARAPPLPLDVHLHGDDPFAND